MNSEPSELSKERIVALCCYGTGRWMTLDVSSRSACSQRCSCRDGGGCSSPSCVQSVRRAAMRLPCVSQCEMHGRPIRQRRPRVLMVASLQTLHAHFRKKGKKHIPEESWGDRTSIRTRRAFEQPWRRAAQRRERASRGPMRSSTRCATHCTPQPGAQG